MTTPIYTFILKVASRCNLNCTYCFVYNKGDERWRAQPKLMSEKTVRQTAVRILEHCRANEMDSAHVTLHGGEPLLGGLAHIQSVVGVIDEVFAGTGIAISIGMQTNGLLITEPIADFCVARGINVGVSIDGPPEINDKFRLDIKGQPSTARLETKLKVLMRPEYAKIFGGFLMVVNVECDPIRAFDYLSSFKPYGVDFILPYDNHDRRPLGKEDLSATPYADWMIRLFDHWLRSGSRVRIRQFDSILQLMFKGHSRVESLGLDPVDIIVVETNGEVEGVDSLKATFEGATVLGMNIFDHSFDEVARHPAVVSRNVGEEGVCATCRGCDKLSICGGGYLPNRYSAERGFDNPSVYCADLKRLIDHIHATVTRELVAAGVVAAA